MVYSPRKRVWSTVQEEGVVYSSGRGCGLQFRKRVWPTVQEEGVAYSSRKRVWSTVPNPGSKPNPSHNPMPRSPAGDGYPTRVHHSVTGIHVHVHVRPLISNTCEFTHKQMLADSDHV